MFWESCWRALSTCGQMAASQCFSGPSTDPFLWGLTEVFLHVWCIPQQNSQWQFWASVCVCASCSQHPESWLDTCSTKQAGATSQSHSTTCLQENPFFYWARTFNMAKGKSGHEIKQTDQSACYIHPRHQPLIVCDPSCRTFAKIIVCINLNGYIRVAGTQPNMSNNSYAEWKMLKHVPFQFNDRKGHGNMAAKLHCFLLKLQSAYKNYIKIMPLIPCQRVAIIMAILAPPSSRHLHTCRFSRLRNRSSRFLGHQNCMPPCG